MRILLANTGHPSTVKGGAEAAVVDLARRLAARGHQVALVVHHSGGELVERMEDGVRVYSLPGRNLFPTHDGRRRAAPMRLAYHLLDSANPFMEQAFGRILDREQPDVVNTHVLVGLSQSAWRAARRRGIPVVHYLHEYATMCPRGSAFSGGKLCERPCASCRVVAAPRKRLSGLVDAVVGVSRFTLDRHLAWGFFPGARASVIPNIFADLTLPRARPAPIPTLRLGYFGRLIPDKGAHLLVEAVRRLRPDGCTLDIAGAGDPDYIARLRAAAPDNVRFLGWTPAVTFFGSIDLLVVPSIWPDPQPRVIFEAYAHGVPVIGTRAGGIPEQIVEDATGWTVAPDSIDALEALLRDRLGDRADRALPIANFRDRLAFLDPDRVILLYEEVFAACVARRRQSGEDVPTLKDKLAEHRGNS